MGQVRYWWKYDNVIYKKIGIFGVLVLFSLMQANVITSVTIQVVALVAIIIKY